MPHGSVYSLRVAVHRKYLLSPPTNLRTTAEIYRMQYVVNTAVPSCRYRASTMSKREVRTIGN